MSCPGGHAGSAARVLVATGRTVLSIDTLDGTVVEGEGLEAGRPTCLAADRWVAGRAWCGTAGGGVFRSDDGGRSWRAAGLSGEEITAITPSPAQRDLVWAGTEPSALWRSVDGGGTWDRAEGLLGLPSSTEWAFPPRPETHHVRWIASHPSNAGRLWLAIEAGALVTTPDGGLSWNDKVPGGPYDTHELAIHPARPETLRSAAGDGYFQSENGGATWTTPERGLEVSYLRSVAVDPGAPDVVVVSGASGPRSAYVAGKSDGRVYRREGTGAWKRVAGWPDPPRTVAPLLASGSAPGELWAADEQGVHRSADGGRQWELVATFAPPPSHLRGLAPLTAVDVRRVPSAEVAGE